VQLPCWRVNVTSRRRAVKYSEFGFFFFNFYRSKISMGENHDFEWFSVTTVIRTQTDLCRKVPHSSKTLKLFNLPSTIIIIIFWLRTYGRRENNTIFSSARNFSLFNFKQNFKRLSKYTSVKFDLFRNTKTPPFFQNITLQKKWSITFDRNSYDRLKSADTRRQSAVNGKRTEQSVRPWKFVIRTY